ncbi:MAG: 1-acyl-sn-glycerol-3-phosphate acyltransferase [Clostridia bacterium]|nr:1-acyl-sn-glycerol-3-phosphate acyltransferase [Clostridia bacterium]
MFYKCVYWLIYVLAKLLYWFKLENVENIPKGAAILSGNHTANVDSVLVILALGPDKQHAAMAKQELFRIPGFGWLIRQLGAYPVTRGGNDIAAVKFSLKALKDGLKLIIFPEGTRVRPGQVVEAKSGAAMMAVKTGVPIVPLHITPGRKMFKGVTVVFGEPYYPQVEGRATAEDYQRITADLMDRIHALDPKKQLPR